VLLFDFLLPYGTPQTHHLSPVLERY
jgi:hypothetical protein